MFFSTLKRIIEVIMYMVTIAADITMLLMNSKILNESLSGATEPLNRTNITATKKYIQLSLEYISFADIFKATGEKSTKETKTIECITLYSIGIHDMRDKNDNNTITAEKITAGWLSHIIFL